MRLRTLNTFNRLHMPINIKLELVQAGIMLKMKFMSLRVLKYQQRLVGRISGNQQHAIIAIGL
ncbi:hypothetical protein SGGMMB4_00607 [Sodalis glossinidius str. 'morsitans']|uniref:Uncharacterized protein n=1 Tax=Sodalis glossinidius (strain morsitans) TaxID=343509 RepID=A0A193QFD6_SODGM|nr:hypothetical protein SGGMMB4_00607 [Sodalis glossinidius str. 'morsitans']